MSKLANFASIWQYGANSLRDPPDEGKLNDREDTLEEGRDSPGPGVGNVLCAKSQPATDQGTKVPQAVVNGSDPGTVLRMRNFGDEHRAGELSQGVAQTHKETSALVLWSAHRGGLNSSSNNHDDTANGDRGLATKSIAKEGYNGERNDGTDRVHGAETTQDVLRGVTHSILPGHKNLRSVHERSLHS